jgi:thiosulfate/3-mercaptopyruvate sulfurtransferase
MMDNLVSTEWLAGELAAAGPAAPLLFDASVYLPTEHIDARARFAEAHIPGAQFFDVNEVADQDTDLPHMVPALGRFEKLMTALGVSNDSRVVFYDQRGLYSAARGWWLLRLFGHGQVAVLDGGLPKWLAEKGAVASGAANTAQSGAANAGASAGAADAVAAAPVRYRARFNARLLRGMRDIEENLASRRELVLDARSAGRFAGTAPEPRPGLAGGHIPGSRSLPLTALLRPDATLLPPEALRRLFALLGVNSQSRVVANCGSGVTAPMISLALAVAGYDPGAVYDGSWTEWGGDPATPKATGS